MSDVAEILVESPVDASGTTSVVLSFPSYPVAAIAGQHLVGQMLQPSYSGPGNLNAISTHIGWFNVKDDFGAYGDGSHDDTSAIQDAINAAYRALVEPGASRYLCGIIFFPPGRYVLSSALYIGVPEATDGGGLVFMGSGVQSESAQQGTILQGKFSGDLIIVNVTGGGGGVTLRDLHIDRGSGTLSSGATFNWLAGINGCLTNVSTEGDYDVLQISQPETSTVTQLYVYGNDFRNVSNRLFHCVGGCRNVHIWDNYVGGTDVDTFVGHFDFSADDICSIFSFRNNDVEGFTGGIYFNNDVGTLEDFWISGNSFDIGNNATKPVFQASASGTARVIQGHIDHNWMPLGNGTQPAPDAIHLDANGAGADGPIVAGIHIEGNVYGGGTSEAFVKGPAIRIANGASDITVVGGRANFFVNAIEIVGSAGTTDGITIIGFGANSPTNGYDSGASGASNATGIAIQPSTGMTVRNVTISGCNLSQCAAQGLLIDSSLGGMIDAVAVVGNSFWGYTGSAVPVTIIGSNNTHINIGDNPGYNPVGYIGSSPAIAIGSAIRNPYPQSVRIAIVSATISSISITAASGGIAVLTGIKPTSEGVLVLLGVGESITLGGATLVGSWKWFLD
jgi:Pectate lyase superfamily protein